MTMVANEVSQRDFSVLSLKMGMVLVFNDFYFVPIDVERKMTWVDSMLISIFVENQRQNDIRINQDRLHVLRKRFFFCNLNINYRSGKYLSPSWFDLILVWQHNFCE